MIAEATLYKVGAICAGAIVVFAIDNVIGIDMESYPKWKRLVHTVAYTVWGGIIAMMP